MYLKHHPFFSPSIAHHYSYEYSILSVAVMSQIGTLPPDWSILAVPCYSPEWNIAIGMNGKANKISVYNKITYWTYA